MFVITDEHVDALYGAKVMGSLESAGYQPEKLVLPPGEKTKAYATMGKVYQAMAAAKLTRKDLVLTLGGGVIGDLGGFAAATYLRGLPLSLIHILTRRLRCVRICCSWGF